LQADGWWLRSMLPWLKRSAMPESVTDRPASAVEYVFLLTKSARYFWDGEAVKRGIQASSLERGYSDAYMNGVSAKMKAAPDDVRAKENWRENAYVPAGRSMRNSDLFYDSLEMPDETQEQRGRVSPQSDDRGVGAAGGAAAPALPLGLICSDDGAPLALDVNPAAFSSAHFATFPPKLVEPLIRAGTSERGCCAQCGAPWVRQVRKSGGTIGTHGIDYSADRGGRLNVGVSFAKDLTDYKVETTGWSPGCAHDAAVVPCVVLDPFSGAGTTLLVADRLQRDAIGIELNPAYGAMADARVVDDAPLLAWGAAQLEAAE
jgi:hypothetical protein